MRLRGLHQHQGAQRQHAGQSRQKNEEAAPAPCRRHSAAHGGPDIGREAHSHPRDAHGRGLTARREADHGDGGHERQKDTGGNRLQDASGQQHPEAGRSQAHERTRKGKPQTEKHMLPCAEAFGNPRDSGHGNPEHEHVAGAQPLAKLHGDAHIRHNTHHHGVHGGLRQVTARRGKDHEREQRIRSAFIGCRQKALLSRAAR